MAAWLRTLWNVALLKTEAYTLFRDQHDAFYRGLVTLVVVSLLGGLSSLAIMAVNAVRSPGAVVVSEAELEQQLEDAFQQAAPYLGQIPDAEKEEIIDMVRQSIGAIVKSGVAIAGLPTVLPKPIPGLLQAIGAYASIPFQRPFFPLGSAALATWLGYGIWVMLFAKLMGGKSTLARFFGTTALFSVPHVLNILSPVATVGTIAGVVAFAWGLVIYVKATAVSHELSVERAILAVLLPAGILLVILVILALIGLGLFGLAIGDLS